MIKRIGIALAALLTLFALTATPANATPNIWHAWDGSSYTGAHADLGPTAGQCLATPFDVGSALFGADNTIVTNVELYNLTNPATQTCDATTLVATLIPGSCVDNISPQGNFYIMA